MAAMRYDVAPEPGGANFLPRYWRSVNTPVLADDGAVRCIIQSVEEVTSAPLTRGRGMREVLSNLTDVLRDLKTPEDIGYQAAAILGDALGTSRVGFGTIDTVRDTLHVVRDWCADGVETLAGQTELRHYGHFIDDLKLGKLIVIGDVDHDSRTAQAAAALRGRSAGAFVNVPVVEHGALVAVLFVNNAAARDWSVEELLLIKEVAARIRTAGERLRVTAALRESEARFRIITEAMPQMVWSNRPDGYNDYHNEQWHGFTGAPRNATDGHRWSEMFHPDDRARAWELWQHCLRTGETYEIEYRLRHHSGAYRWVLGRALPLDLRDVLHHAVEQAQPTIDARQHRLVLDLAPGATLVLGDRLRLVQVVVNLLNNAARYTPPGGAVTLALAAADGQARIEVTDTGCGIEPALLPHVFDLFIQAKRTPDRQQGGLGLGLALVQRIAALHDGSVRAFSDGAGLGSRFVITLPVLSVLPGADTAG